MNPIYILIKTLVLPPACLIVAAGLGVLLWKSRPAFARWLTGLSVLALYLLSTPFVANTLTGFVQHPVVDPASYTQAVAADDEDTRPQAIVVIAGGLSEYAPEYEGATVNEFTLVRIRYAAKLQRDVGLPLLVSGGATKGGSEPEAVLMDRTLRTSFGVTPDWIEPNSKTTWGNAQESMKILGEQGITRIFLVTHAIHMPRSKHTFERAGFTVIAAPTGYYGAPHLSWETVLPRSNSLHQSHYAVYELLGRLTYIFRR